MNSTFQKILEAQEIKAANWAKEADGFEALYVEMLQDALTHWEDSLHGAKQYTVKNYEGFLKNRMLKVEF